MLTLSTSVGDRDLWSDSVDPASGQAVLADVVPLVGGPPVTTNPPTAELERWWRCGRKLALAGEGVASLAAGMHPGASYYPCPWEAHWHVGRTPARAGRWDRKHARRAWAPSNPPESRA